MGRLPIPGADSNTWGDVLNDFLLQAHNPSGALKINAVTEATITDGSVSETKLASSVQSKLNDTQSAVANALRVVRLRRPVRLIRYL